MTVLQLALLCRLVSIDVPPGALSRVRRGLTAGDLARAALKGPACAALDEAQKHAFGQIALCRNLAELRVVGYENDNEDTGFVGYAFAGAGGPVIVGFRGSESTLSCAPSNIDWLDNLRAPLAGSWQYPRVRRFAARFANGPVLFTGHSKGGHNALYALATSTAPDAACVCFDAQGFAPGQIPPEQALRLKERAVNYVQYRDAVGALLCHPERRVFVAGTGAENAHALEAMAYDLLGSPVPARRAASSVAIGIASCLLAGFLRHEMARPEPAAQLPQNP